MTFVSSPPSGRLPHLSFVLCSPPKYFSHRQKSREIPQDFYPCCISNISLSVLPSSSSTVREWMGGRRGFFHQSLTSVFCPHQPPCQFTRLTSQLLPPHTVCCRKCTKPCLKDADCIAYKAKWGHTHTHSNYNTAYELFWQACELSVSVCIRLRFSTFFTVLASVALWNRWAKVVIFFCPLKIMYFFLNCWLCVTGRDGWWFI